MSVVSDEDIVFIGGKTLFNDEASACERREARVCFEVMDDDLLQCEMRVRRGHGQK